MNTGNPTPLEIGMTGTLGGQSYAVTARLVLEMEEEGETYHWNEYVLSGADGRTATLVHEPVEVGFVLRLFTLFDPELPLTVEQAGLITVGQEVDLGDGPIRVTLVDESRVVHVEGRPPDWIERGDQARYFNAEEGRRRIVVSWTGGEIEFYRGMDIPYAVMASGFGIERVASEPAGTSSASQPLGVGYGLIAMGVLLAAVVIVGVVLMMDGPHGEPSSKPVVAPPPVEAPRPLSTELKVGGSASIHGQRYQVLGRDSLEVAVVGRNYACSRFIVRGQDGRERWLLHGLRGTKSEWHLLAPSELSQPMSPAQAAVKVEGQALSVDGFDCKIERLFLDQVTGSEGATVSSVASEKRHYHFLAQSGQDYLLASWGAEEVRFHRGILLGSKPEVFLPNE